MHNMFPKYIAPLLFMPVYKKKNGELFPYDTTLETNFQIPSRKAKINLLGITFIC